MEKVNMKKDRKSVLDGYAKKLLKMDRKKASLAKMQKWLKRRDIKVTTTTISRFLLKRRDEQLAKEVLSRLATVARQTKRVQDKYRRRPNQTLRQLVECASPLALWG
jgi:predicted transcriptional regulator